MADLMKWASGQSVQPVRATQLSRSESLKIGRSLTRMEAQADMQVRAAELEAEVGYSKVQTVAAVGNAALTAQTLIASRERLLVEIEPGAIHGVAYIGQKLTLALGDVVDQTVREVGKR